MFLYSSSAGLGFARAGGAFVVADCDRRLDGHGGLAAARSQQAAAIAKKEVLYIMRPVVRINHRRLRIVPHSAGAKQMHAKLLFPSRITPFFLSARCLVDLSCPLNQPVGKL